MWWLLIKAIIKAIAIIVIGELLRPKPKFDAPKPNALGDFNFPTAQEGRTIPIGWGTFEVSGPNVTWYGDLRVVPIKQKQKTGMFSSSMVTIGYKYWLGVEHSLCFGPIDEFLGLVIDDKDVPMTETVITADTTFFRMNSPTLFGKEKEQGGVKGPVRVYHGTFTQTQNEYMRVVLAQEEMPAYRPIARVIFEHCYLGNAGTVQPPKFRVRRTPNPLGLTGGKHNLGGDANPANMVFEIMTDRTWGMGIPASLIDTATFIAVADTLAAEGLGLSMLVDNTQGGDKLIAEILRHVDGVIYQDFATGLFKIALVRNDYDAETALVLDESNIVPGTFEFGRSSWEDTQNTVIVKYLDRAQKFTERAIQQQNLANISARNGQIEAEEYDFLGFSRPEPVNYTCARILRTVSSPLAKVELEASRVAYRLRPASVFRLNYPQLGIESLIFRVTEIDYGTIDRPNIKITAVEDIFSVSDAAYSTPAPSGWTNPISDPQPVAAQRLLEPPRGMFGDARLVLAYAQRAGGQDLGYTIETDPAGGTAFLNVGDVGGFAPTGTLVNAYGASTHGADATGFIITTNGEGLDDLLSDLSNTLTAVKSGENLLLIDNEIMAFSGLVDNNNGTWTVTGVVQGAMDTVPTYHAIGSRVWFLTAGGFGAVTEQPLAADSTVRVRLRPFSALKTLPASSAVSTTLATVSRYTLPYPPGGVTVNTAHFRNAVIAGANTALALAWKHRDRLAQVNQQAVLYGSDPNLGPEAGVSYTIKLYDETNVLRRTVTGHTADNYTWTTEADDCGLVDWQGDTLSANVRALLHADGVVDSNVAVDIAGATWTPSGGFKISTIAGAFGGTMFYFNAAEVCYVLSPQDTKYSVFGADCTVEFRYRKPSNTGNQCLVEFGNGISNRLNISIVDGNLVVFSDPGTAGGIKLTTPAPAVDTLHHVALERVGSTFYLLLNGAVVSSASFTPPTGSFRVCLGRAFFAGGSNLTGYIEEFRITGGISRYGGSAYTVPTAAHPGIRRLNSAGRVVIETHRGAAKSLQDHDFTWTRPAAAP